MNFLYPYNLTFLKGNVIFLLAVKVGKMVRKMEKDKKQKISFREDFVFSSIVKIFKKVYKNVNK